MPGWWPVRKTRALADMAEEAADRAMREVVMPLRELRASGDHVTDAVVADIVRRREHEG
jgi:hypothetical protein